METVSDWLLDNICKLGIRYAFLVPGMEIDAICSAMDRYPDLTPIVACHEEGAGFMADGYSRVKNSIGLCMAIGAPGAANTIPAILNARADCSKVLFLTGGSPTSEAGRGTFQNSAKSGTNDIAVISQAARYSQVCDLPLLVPLIWRNAIEIIEDETPGPAHIAILQDLQTKEMTTPDFTHDYKFSPTKHRMISTEQLEALVVSYLKRKKNIVFYIGRGAVLSEAKEVIQALIEKYHIPFTASMGGKGYLPETHPLYLGLWGYAGLGKVSFAIHKRAMEALISPDLEVIISIGSSLSFFASLYRHKKIKPSADIVQIDINSLALERDYPVQLKIPGDCKASLDYLNNLPIPELQNSIAERKEWLRPLQSLPFFYQTERISENQSAPIDPAYAVHVLNKIAPDNTILFIDTGVHSPIAGHFWICRQGGGTVYASNLGPMGFAIPAAIGGKLAAPDHPVVVVTGDGCMRMHGIEIMTAVHYQIPVVILVSNNSALGKVYLRAENVNETAKDITLLPQANWAEFAKSLGADGIQVTDPKDLPPACEQAFAANGPFVIDVITNREVPVIE